MRFIYGIVLFLFLSGCYTEPEEVSFDPIQSEVFGVLPSGEEVTLFTLRNEKGMQVSIMDYGGTIVKWTAPDKNGTYEDITLGMDSLKGYLDGVPYFGALIGRYGNRIAKGQFELDGKSFSLAKNNGENSLHGGLKGFDKVLWEAIPAENQASLRLSYTSMDGEEGYPGNLEVSVLYELKDDNSLSITYEAETDKKTVLNLTNHAYFNLGTQGKDVLDHELRIAADRYLPVDAGLIPTGELAPVVDSPMDFTQLHSIGERINDSSFTQIKIGGGYDHCWVFTDSTENLKKVAEVRAPTTGRTLIVKTTEPAVQFYSGNFLDGTLIGKNGIIYGRRSGFCLETQHYPDSPNQDSFPSTVLEPGNNYISKTVYQFGIMP